MGYASYFNPSEDCFLRGETTNDDGFDDGDDLGSVLAYVSKADMTTGSCAETQQKRLDVSIVQRRREGGRRNGRKNPS